ncbi:MAG: phosphoenolpyruvate carboxykinase (ATP) [Vampirovibrionales bacterium]|nr:phosphoenolpyruvate carboxykinase (ATP) [Vampirovibrionales bacterium]
MTVMTKSENSLQSGLQSTKASYCPFETSGRQFYQLSVSALIEHAVLNQEGDLSENGALSVRTGKFTGRAPNNRFIVDTPNVHGQIDWGNVNKPISKEVYEKVYNRISAYLAQKDLYIFDGFCGAEESQALSVRFINELASQNLFVHQMFIRPSKQQLKGFTPEFTVLAAPQLDLDSEQDGVGSETAIILNLETKTLLVAGTKYAGEMKKGIFSVMNYLMPERGVFPMHCSCNVGKDGKSALFFGLSGTGKTTLSADPERYLIGDDEHGWSESGVFNFEGGCYAKAIRLSKENEPEIWDAIKYGALAENIVLDKSTRVFDYDDDAIAENSRVAYPIHYIPNADLSGKAAYPSTVIFLTADAFGVMPPIAKLTKEQAQYHFISGYTSKVAGTEQGIKEPQAAFSRCFGAPFMPRRVSEYAKMLEQRISKNDVSGNNVNVYLINTGWQGGPYGVGKRVSIPYTRAIVTAALDGTLEGVEFVQHPVLNVLVPKSCPGVPDEILDPRNSWQDKAAYDKQVVKLASMFIENFKQFSGVDHLIAAGPRIK